MSINQEIYNEVMEYLNVGTEQLRDIACSFRHDIERKLAGKEDSTLPMLPSYIGLPEGNETGDYLALDFGGTNLRVLHIKLLGNSQHEIIKKVARPLVTPEYNLINKNATQEQLFDFIADMVAEAIDGLAIDHIYLGHTFSFGSVQENIYNARLIAWNKEFEVPGVEGEIVNDLLKAALTRKGITNVEPNSVINDTVAVLLTAAYKYPDTRIGLIYATGYNACYLESFNGTKPADIINMESGAFGKLVQQKYDRILDEKSLAPGRQKYEKMISGRYMGEQLTLMLTDILGLTFTKDITAIDMSAILADETPAAPKRILKEKAAAELTDDEAKLVQDLTIAVSTRSARLCAAGMAGVLWHIAGDKEIAKQHIAIDGSVYEHMPKVKENVLKALYELLGEEAANVDPILVTGGSGVGAAIAAAVAAKA